jgi:NAD(P)H-hydrate epimerase
MTALLTVAEMKEADRLAMAAGVPSLTLMENAGGAVAEAVAGHYAKGRVLVLCGPGNNGGDGFVAARHLKERGYDVSVALLGTREGLKGDAAAMAKQWKGEVLPLAPDLAKTDLIVDALFGAGLARPLEGLARDVVLAANRSGVPIVAIDVPSGLAGDLGRSMEGPDGVCIHAALTITFFLKKPGHLLIPGRFFCGKLVVADIGIPGQALETIRPSTFENASGLWRYPWPDPMGHKYDRGHAVMVSGPAHATGAARLAARGALRVGAGLVSVASPVDAVAINAAHLTAIMLKPFAGADGLRTLLSDQRLNAVALGPGLGVGGETPGLVAAALESGAAVVLDADALTSFAGERDALWRLTKNKPCVMTPHEGEFARLFPGLLQQAPSRLAAARMAADEAGCIILLKGPDSVIAADGRAAINANAPPWLATAGAGDVLSGMIAGLMAQHMAPFEAACAAAWLHGEAATGFGPGLIAEDLPEQLPGVLAKLPRSSIRLKPL